MTGAVPEHAPVVPTGVIPVGPSRGTIIKNSPREEQCEERNVSEKDLQFPRIQSPQSTHSPVSVGLQPQREKAEKGLGVPENSEPGAVVTTRLRSHFLPSQPPQCSNTFLLPPLPVPVLSPVQTEVRREHQACRHFFHRPTEMMNSPLMCTLIK